MVRTLILIAIVMTSLLAGNSGVIAETAPPLPSGCVEADEAGTPVPTAEPSPATPEPAEELPGWQTTELRDVCSGVPFTLASFSGKTVYVQIMATWCGNCFQQMQNVRNAAEELGEDFVFVALSGEVGLEDDVLKDYAETHDFPFVFAVMTEPMLISLVEHFGREVAAPFNTPHFLVGPNLASGELRLGGESGEKLVDAMTDLQDAGQM